MQSINYPTIYQQNITPPTNYPTFDISSINPYNYKDFTDRNNIYQQYQDMYYYTRQINPISIVNDNSQPRDPSNIPTDLAFKGIYEQGDANNRDPLNIQRSIQNNPNLWRDKQPVPGYYRPNEPQIAPRPISYINLGHATSDIYNLSLIHI